eukprot:c2421_g1_i1.p1 GENE.c2421_g1_i1~~c2421_g1_i1.p1  ORF type:complete len:163 (+),score=31.24 c2421_g1_i1:253-741(+)
MKTRSSTFFRNDSATAKSQPPSSSVRHNSSDAIRHTARPESMKPKAPLTVNNKRSTVPGERESPDKRWSVNLTTIQNLIRPVAPLTAGPRRSSLQRGFSARSGSATSPPTSPPSTTTPSQSFSRTAGVRSGGTIDSRVVASAQAAKAARSIDPTGSASFRFS